MGNTRPGMKKIIVGVLLLLTVAGVWSMEACPSTMQAVLTVKIIPFIKEYQTSQTFFQITIGVYGDNEIAAHLQAAAQRSAVRIFVVVISKTDPVLDGLQIVYIPYGTSPTAMKSISRQAKQKKILTVCGDPYAALSQNMSLSFYVYDEKPKILINMKSSRLEGVSFSSRVLRLADLRD